MGVPTTMNELRPTMNDGANGAALAKAGEIGYDEKKCKGTMWNGIFDPLGLRPG